MAIAQLLSGNINYFIRDSLLCSYQLLENHTIGRYSHDPHQVEKLRDVLYTSNLFNIGLVCWDLTVLHEKWTNRTFQPISFFTPISTWNSREVAYGFAQGVVVIGTIYLIAKTMFSKQDLQYDIEKEKVIDNVTINTQMSLVRPRYQSIAHVFYCSRAILNLGIACLSSNRFLNLFTAAIQAYSLYKSYKLSWVQCEKTFTFSKKKSMSPQEIEQSIDDYTQTLPEGQITAATEMHFQQEGILLQRDAIINLFRAALRDQINQQNDPEVILQKVVCLYDSILVPTLSSEDCATCHEPAPEVYACSNHSFHKKCSIEWIGSKSDGFFNKDDFNINKEWSQSDDYHCYVLRLFERTPSCPSCRGKYLGEHLRVRVWGKTPEKPNLTEIKTILISPLPKQKSITSVYEYGGFLNTAYSGIQAALSWGQQIYPEFTNKIISAQWAWIPIDIASLIWDVFHVYVVDEEKRMKNAKAEQAKVFSDKNHTIKMHMKFIALGLVSAIAVYAFNKYRIKADLLAKLLQQTLQTPNVKDLKISRHIFFDQMFSQWVDLNRIVLNIWLASLTSNKVSHLATAAFQAFRCFSTLKQHWISVEKPIPNNHKDSPPNEISKLQFYLLSI